MKVGDKFICIKSVKHYYKNFKRISHIKGKIYEVSIESKKMHDIEYVYMVSEETTTSNGYLGFFISGDRERYSDWSLFKEHFVSLKEYRKLKLEKLNESR